MKESTIISLQALGIALDKLSLTAVDLDNKLDEQITLKILRLEELCKQNITLNKLYDVARLDV